MKKVKQELIKEELKKEFSSTTKGYYGNVYPSFIDDLIYDLEQVYKKYSNK